MLTMSSTLVRAERCFVDQLAMIDADGKEICRAQHVEDVARLAVVGRHRSFQRHQIGTSGLLLSDKAVMPEASENLSRLAAAT